MKIGLIDVDGHNYPNLALMKISAWHKARGDIVEWWWGFGHYDRVYMSKVFDETYTPDIDDIKQSKHGTSVPERRTSMRTCDNCACDRVCDHNWNGFETCGNWISMDAVPVVRCRECKHAWIHPCGYVFCHRDGRNAYEMTFNLDSFCSYGERKEGAD